MTFSELLPRVVAARKDKWPYRVCVIATRYYLGAESRHDLVERTIGRFPTLTEREVFEITEWEKP